MGAGGPELGLWSGFFEGGGEAGGGHGETRTRTGDTTIFSRVLYQLSYLAVRPQPRRARGWARSPADGGTWRP